ncbi:LysR substrate-binding domain-containing protein [Eremococcus coleocola]|uniref:LysR substrate-binding domain-containing protein n=1 Tax=Eremococcus coleocola TaxID=88132 RepID=UPI003CCAD70E
MFPGNQGEIHQRLENGKSDIAFTSKYGSDDFEYNPILKDELVAVLPLDHPLAKDISVPIAKIQDYTYICSGEKIDFEIGDILKGHHIKPIQTLKYLMRCSPFT